MAAIRYNILTFFETLRGVAQPGSAFGSGPKGQGFESPLPDHLEFIFAQSGRSAAW